MRLTSLLFVVAILAFGTTLHAETWTDVTMIDTLCSGKFENPDEHTVACALQCAKGGYGIVDAKGTFIRFDEKGDELAVAALRKAKGKDHIRVTVKGELRGEVLHVESLILTTGSGR